MAQIREWRQQYGKSVRPQSVCNMSTKDRPGTLPVNAYEDETDILESDPIKRYDCLWFLEDLLPFHFTES
ncbi:unnamed protein product, partial [Porites evermanni]